MLSTSEPASSSTPTFAIPHFAIFVQSRFCYCNFCRCHSERSRLCCDYFSLLLIFSQLHFCCTPSNILSIANFIWFFQHPPYILDFLTLFLHWIFLPDSFLCDHQNFPLPLPKSPSNSSNPSKNWIFLVKIYSL